MHLSRFFQLKPVFRGAKKTHSIHSLSIPTIKYYTVLNDTIPYLMILELSFCYVHVDVFPICN